MTAARFLLPLLAFATPAFAEDTGSAPMETPIAYPETQRGDVVEEQFGVAVADPYRWLENDVRNDQSVRDWVTAQNAVTDAYLETLPGRDAIAALGRAPSPGVVAEHLAHHLGCEGHEVGPVVHHDRGIARQAQPGLVDERRGLQRVSWPLSGHVAGSEPTELVVDQGHELGRGPRVAGAEPMEDLGRNRGGPGGLGRARLGFIVHGAAA